MAEVLADQLNWSQALDVGEQAVSLAPQVMDVHRAYAKVLESSGDYTGAIDSYQRAIALNPNLPFLYLSMGANYRYRRKPIDDLNAMQRDIDAAWFLFDGGGFNPKTRPSCRSPVPTPIRASSSSPNVTRRRRDSIHQCRYLRRWACCITARVKDGSLPVLRRSPGGCTSAENEEGTAWRAMTWRWIRRALLSASTLNYYYTYGSALPISAIVRGPVDLPNCAPRRDDSDGGIIQVGEQICAGPAGPMAVPALNPRGGAWPRAARTQVVSAAFRRSPKTNTIGLLVSVEVFRQHFTAPEVRSPAARHRFRGRSLRPPAARPLRARRRSPWR
jgi:hypothetical protein